MTPEFDKGKLYRRDVDGLRAIAILLVLLYHLFPDTIRGGFIGVDIFFVISGFIISKTITFDLDRNSFSIKVFLFKRIRRLYPALLTVLISAFVLGWILLMPAEFSSLNKHILSALSYIQNFTLWNEVGYFDESPQQKPLLHLWSLSIEEQFYIIYPWVLFWVYRLRKIRFIYLLFFFLISFIINISFVRSNPEFTFYWPISRFWELLSGCILALIHSDVNRVRFQRYENVGSFLGLILIIIASFLFSKVTTFPGAAALLPVLGSAVIIYFDQSILNRGLLSSRIFVFIGLISYPLYLWHWILISFEYYAFGGHSSFFSKICILFISVFLAWITYKYIEKPIRSLRKLKVVSLALLTVSVALALLSLLTIFNAGFPSRKNAELPVELHELLKPDFGGYIAKNWREHTCFLAKDETYQRFSQSCLEDSGNTRVVIWGDSHAAALYSGFRSLQEQRKFDLSQYTASACAPLLIWEGLANRNCNSLNRQIFENIANIKPEIIILHASWSWDEYNLKFLEITIQNLKRINNARIIIIGQAPNWKVKVPENIIAYFKTFGKLPMPNTDFGLNEFEETLRLERKIKKIAEKQRVEFVSIIDVLCPQNQCLLYVGDSVQNVTSLDQGHLSDLGASFVVQAVEKKIFPGN